MKMMSKVVLEHACEISQVACPLVYPTPQMYIPRSVGNISGRNEGMPESSECDRDSDRMGLPIINSWGLPVHDEFLPFGLSNFSLYIRESPSPKHEKIALKLLSL